MHYNCLIVDDEIELAQMTCEYFQMFEVSCAYVADANSCEAFLKEHTIDILLLDINLQEESGFQLCKRIRETSQVPILFISARQSDDDILIALNIGGDDYIKKPYTLSVLLAKVKVMLKRTRSVNTVTVPPEDQPMYLDEKTMRVCSYGRQIQLKAKEFKLLQYLFAHKNTILTKEQLFAAVWGDGFYGDGTLNVHIRKLREKIEKDPNAPELIKTIWGTGYMLEL